MSTTISAIPSGPTNAGTHYSSTAQRSWRGSLYFRMIRTWRVGEIEFQNRLARFVISKWLELRGLLAGNQNGVWMAIWWIWWKERCATRKGGVPDVECRVGKGSADVDWGAQNVIDGSKSRPRRANRGWGAPIQRSSQPSSAKNISVQAELVFATGPHSRFGSGSSCNPEPDCCNWFPPKTRHFKSTILAPIKYLSSDRIVTWSVRRLCSFSPSCPSRSQIWDPTSIRWVAIENPHFSPDI